MEVRLYGNVKTINHMVVHDMVICLEELYMTVHRGFISLSTNFLTVANKINLFTTILRQMEVI